MKAGLRMTREERPRTQIQRKDIKDRQDRTGHDRKTGTVMTGQFRTGLDQTRRDQFWRIVEDSIGQDKTGPVMIQYTRGQNEDWQLRAGQDIIGCRTALYRIRKRGQDCKDRTLQGRTTCREGGHTHTRQGIGQKKQDKDKNIP